MNSQSLGEVAHPSNAMFVLEGPEPHQPRLNFEQRRTELPLGCIFQAGILPGCDSPTSQLPSLRPKYRPPPPKMFPGLHKLQNRREVEGRMFIAVLVPFFLPVPFGSLCSEGLEGDGQRGLQQSPRCSCSGHLESFTAPKTLLAAADLAVLEPLSARGWGGSNPSLLPVPGFCRALGIPPKKAQFEFRSHQRKGTPFKLYPALQVLLTAPGKLSKRMRETPRVTLAPRCRTKSQEMILFFSSLPLRETRSRS